MKPRTTSLVPFTLALAPLFVASCGSSSTTDARGVYGSGGAAGNGGADAGPAIDGSSLPGLDASGIDDAATEPLGDGACAATEVSATKLPVDIMVLVDTSGSTFQYTDQTQKNINALPAVLANSGLDYRLAMVASPQNPVSIPFVPNVCVPPPLGGPNCTSNPPNFRSIVYDIGNHNSLDAVLATYADPVFHWNDFFRPDAFKAFIVISDDYPALTAADFDAKLLALDPAMFGTAQARKYAGFPIAESLKNNPSVRCNPLDFAGNPAPEYVNLATLTGGDYYEICQSDYGPIFQAIGTHLASQLACQIDVPQPPAGQTLDYGEVNVVVTDGMGAQQTIAQDTSACATANGWQYTPDMKQIVLCGAACSQVQADLGAKLSVEVGCATVTIH